MRARCWIPSPVSPESARLSRRRAEKFARTPTDASLMCVFDARLRDVRPCSLSRWRTPLSVICPLQSSRFLSPVSFLQNPSALLDTDLEIQGAKQTMHVWGEKNCMNSIVFSKIKLVWFIVRLSTQKH